MRSSSSGFRLPSATARKSASVFSLCIFVVLVEPVHNVPDAGELLHDIAVAVAVVRQRAVDAGLHARLRIGEISAALVAEHVERAIAEQAIKIFRFVCFMAREKLAFLMLKKLEVFGFHFIHSDFLSPQVSQLAVPALLLFPSH